MALTKYVPITYLIWKKKGDMHMGINVTFYLFVSFVGLSGKFIIVISFLLLLIHFNALPRISFFFCGSYRGGEGRFHCTSGFVVTSFHVSRGKSSNVS
jgi:hypothetical protein